MRSAAAPPACLVMLSATFSLVASASAHAQDSPVGIAAPASRTADVTLWMGGGQDVGVRDSQGRLGLELAYTKTHGRLLVSPFARADARIDRTAAGGVLGSDQRAALVFGYEFTHRTRIDTTQMVNYAAVNPFAIANDSGATAGHPVALPPDYPLTTGNALTYRSDAALTHAMTRRTSVTGTYSWTYADNSERRPLTAYMVGGDIAHRVSPDHTLRFGYRTGVAQVDAVPVRHLQSHDVIAGSEYSRELPFWRHTSIVAGSGSSLVSDGTRWSVRVLGNVSVVRELPRSWSARVSYGRPMQIMEGLAEPLIANWVGTTIGGAIGTHSRVTMTAGHFDGSVGIDKRGSRVKSTTGSILWERVISRRFAWNTSAFYGWSRFGPDVVVPADIPANVSRLGLRAFVTYKPPVLGD